METPTIGWSGFALERNFPGMGFTFATISPDQVVQLVKDNWFLRKPGYGEIDLSRKVVVPVPTHQDFGDECGSIDRFGFDAGTPWFRCGTTALRLDMNIRAKVTQRREGEDLHVETFITPDDAKACGVDYSPAKFASIVLYSREALFENGEHPDTDADWEVVAVLGGNMENEPMHPLAMARNQLEKPGETKTTYTPEQWAEAVWYWSTQRGIKIIEDK